MSDDRNTPKERDTLNEIKRVLVTPEQGSGIGLASMMGLSKQELDAMYVTACQQVQAGQGAQAAKLFGTLIALNHHEGKYWRGMGLSMQRMRLWPMAEFAYLAALKRDEHDFVSRIFLAEVLLKLNRPSRARNEVDRGIEEGRKLAKPDSVGIVKRGEKLRAFIISAGESHSGVE